MMHLYISYWYHVLKSVAMSKEGARMKHVYMNVTTFH